MESFEGPAPELRFRPKIRLFQSMRELWQSRELVLTLAERDLKVRYKQTVLGVAWAVLTPLVLMVVFSLFFRRVARVDTGGVPYSLFAFVGLVPWTFFSACVSQGGMSLISNYSLLNKVYCPREVFPIGSMFVAAFDSAVSLGILAILFAINGFAPKPTSAWIPVLVLVQVTFSLGVALILSSLIVYFRDVRHVLPILLQLGLFATPVAYGIDLVPGEWRLLYAAVNPLAAVIDGYRRAVLFGAQPDWPLLAAGAITALVWLCGGYLFFKRLEVAFADVA